MKSKVVSFVFVTAIAQAATVNAQEQTIESAQEFLAQTLPNVEVNINMWERDGKPTAMGRYAPVRTVTTSSRCVSVLNVSYPEYTIYRTEEEMRQGTYGWYPVQKKVVDASWGSWDVSFQLDFRKVTEVSGGGGSIDVKRQDKPGYPVRFTGLPEGMRKRIAFAMEFLRTKCDKAAGTGF